MAGIFISYRERDSKGWALSLRDRLVEAFGEEKVFLDKDALRAGKWKDQIERALGDCNIVLVVIGRGWLSAVDDQSRQRLMLEDDVHRREIALALSRPDVTVIPVLVDGAAMPKVAQLPSDISTLTQQQSRAISDSAAHRKVDLDSLIGDIQRVGGLAAKSVPGPTPIPIPIPKPDSSRVKNSGKAIAALSLVGLIVLAVASDGGLDHDGKFGGIFFMAIALWLAVRSYGDVKTGLRKGRGLSFTAIGATGLTTLALLGSLTQSDPPAAPIVSNLLPAAPVAPASRAPIAPALDTTPVVVKAPPQTQKRTKPTAQAKFQDEPVQHTEPAAFGGIWQDGHDLTIFYVLRQEDRAVYLQQYNGYGALTFEATGVPIGTELTIDHPRLTASLALSNDGRQLTGSSKEKANGLSRPLLMRKVDLDALDPQIAQLLRPLVQ
jgi:TIR domain